MPRNPYFCQFLANALKKQVLVPENPELTAIGVAMMASGANGNFGATGANSKAYTPGDMQKSARDRFASAVSKSRDWRRG